VLEKAPCRVLVTAPPDGQAADLDEGEPAGEPRSAAPSVPASQ
jgi:hypothetical protein